MQLFLLNLNRGFREGLPRIHEDSDDFIINYLGEGGVKGTFCSFGGRVFSLYASFLKATVRMSLRHGVFLNLVASWYDQATVEHSTVWTMTCVVFLLVSF